MRIGVAIPAYNAGRFIKSCVESVLNQSYLASQIVVCDDASTDDTVERVRELQLRHPDRIELLIHPQNMGIPHTFNTGLAAIRTKYVTFLAGDDLWREDKLEREVPLLNGDVTCVYSLCGLVDEEGRYIRKMRRRFDGCSGDICFEMLMHEMSFRSALLNVALLRRVGGFNEDLHMFEDWEMKIRYLQHSRVACSGEETVFYRQHPRGMSKRADRATYYRNLVKVFENVKPIIQSLPKTQQREICRHRFDEMTQLLRHGLLNERRTIYWKSWYVAKMLWVKVLYWLQEMSLR